MMGRTRWREGNPQFKPLRHHIRDDQCNNISPFSTSVATIDECIRNYQRYTSCTLVEAIEAATLHPAQALGIAHQKGTLDYGADADLVFLDDELKVLRVFVAGEEVDLEEVGKGL